MTLSPGTRLGPYEIVSPLGAGGMGEVYRAKDTRVDRTVALKVLPEEFFEDDERRARFEREAKLLASLNHPGIATLFSFEEISGRHVLSMELVEGEDLAQRVSRGPLPLEESLSYARQIAEALEAAHERGVVHRDLKPANVKLTKDGAVKILDFGLAKAWETDPGASDGGLTQSPTMSRNMTEAGVILGTAAYMSPEQARGRPVDRRADIWSFGVVLFEMLTGRRPFGGETVSDILASVIKDPPDLTALGPSVPAGIARLIDRCLRKDPRARLRDIGDARQALEDVQSTQASSSSMRAGGKAASVSRRPFEWARLVVVALLAAAGAWFVPRAFRGSEGAQPSRFTIPQPDDVFLNNENVSPMLSPDGRSLAFVTFDSTSKTQIWLRNFESTVAKPIAGTKGVERTVFWSPDSRQICFNAENKLKRIPVTGGDAEVVCPVTSARGGSWNRDGVMLIAPNPNSGIYRVAAGGGDPQPVTVLDTTRGETSHRYPQFLPDGRHFLFTVLPARAGKFDTYLGLLDSPKRTLLLSAGTGAT